MTQLPDACRVEGIRVHSVTRKSLLSILRQWAAQKIPRKIYYVNVHAMNLAYKEARFRESLLAADLVFCDGYGVWLASRLSGVSLPERLTPPDWVDDFLEMMALDGKSVYLLGDEQGIAIQCAEAMQKRHPALAIAGANHGFFSIDGNFNSEAVEAIRRSGAAVLLVGMGMPRQEFWIDSNLKQLGVSLAISVGALFRWYTHAERRAPRWVTDYGMEWLARLIRHPFRHFRRYVIGNPSFFARVLIDRFRRTTPAPP